MAVEGRWTLRWVASEITDRHPARPNAVASGPNVDWHGTDVPVVPCDDAAVERGAKALFEAMEDVADIIPDVAVLAEAVLRAAGGQDA